MKNLNLIVVLILIGFTANSQNFNIGISTGLPTGKAARSYTYNLAFEASHLWKLSDKFDLGILTGYSYYVVDESNDFPNEDMSFLPIAAAARFNISNNFEIGFDLGGAFGASGDSINEGVYFAYKIEYRMSDSFDIVAARRILTYDMLTGASRAVVSIGLEYSL